MCLVTGDSPNGWGWWVGTENCVAKEALYHSLKNSPEKCECVCMSSCFVCFLLTGGRYVKVWDVLKGGQLLVSLKNHHKTVTCLCLNSSGQRLLSGSLDRLVYFVALLWFKFFRTFSLESYYTSLWICACFLGLNTSVSDITYLKTCFGTTVHSAICINLFLLLAWMSVRVACAIWECVWGTSK